MGRWFPLPVLLTALLVGARGADARTRLFCKDEPYYSGKAVNCGRHLQPACSSAPACDDGFNSYSGSPFPITIDCPTIDLGIFGEHDIPDVKLNSGCYDRRPTCASCGGQGEPPCPQEVAGVCDVGCDAGLEIDTDTLTCEAPGPAEIPCIPGAGTCPFGLTCSLAGLCSHKPALEGETCDITAPCASGLTCTAGIPQRCNAPGEVGDSCHLTKPCRDGLFCQAGTQTCQAYRLPGEGCSAFNPCIEGASCEACFTSRCHSPLQCFWNGNNGLLTEHQCRKLYSPGDSAFAVSQGQTLTYATGFSGTPFGVSGAVSTGFAYGDDGSYGCLLTSCVGLLVDAANVEWFISVGEYDSFEDVGNPEGALSFINVQQLQVPGSLLNFAFTQVYPDPLTPIGSEIGFEEAMSIGVGANPAPFTAGSFECVTVLDPIHWNPDDPFEAAAADAVAARNEVINANFDVDLEGWSCTNGGVCAWVPDDPDASTLSGAGEVTSPPSGSASTVGRLEASCVAVEENALYELSAWVRTAGALPGSLVGVWSSSPECVGGVLRSDVVAGSPPDDTWRYYAGVFAAPAGAQGVRLEVIAQRDAATQSESSTQIDRAFVPEPSPSASLAVALATLLGLAAARGPSAPARTARSAGVARVP